MKMAPVQSLVLQNEAGMGTRTSCVGVKGGIIITKQNEDTIEKVLTKSRHKVSQHLFIEGTVLSDHQSG